MIYLLTIFLLYSLIAHSASDTWFYCLLITGHLHTSHSCLHFLGSSAGKESAYDSGDPGLIPGSGRFPGGGHGNPLQYSCLENPHGQRSLADYSPWGCRVRHNRMTKHSTSRYYLLFLFNLYHSTSISTDCWL